MANLSNINNKFLVTTGGNVGINTTSPTNAKLVISDTGSNKISIDGGTSQNGMRWEAVGGANAFYLFNGTFGSAGFGLYNINTTQAPLWIQNGGNVGIGTTTPTLGKLQVAGSGYFGPVGTGNATTKAEMQSNAVLRLKPHDSNSTNMNFAQVDGGASMGIQVTNGPGTANWDIALSPFGGNVGIGTTSPDANLHVNSENTAGTVIIGRTGTNIAASTSIGTITFPADYNSSAANYAQIRAYSNNLSAVRASLDLNVKSTSGTLLTGLTVYGTSSGVNVGIGTASPGYKLSVANGSTRIVSINYQDNLNTIMSHAGSPNYGLEALTIRGDYIAFYTDYDTSHYQGLERMRINSSGDVGIGTTPETAGPTWRTLFVGASATIVSRQAASGYDSIFANNYYVNSSNQDRVRTTGPSSRMFLDGNNIRFQISPSTGAGGSPTWSEIMRIDDSGNVGIGTNSPSELLEVMKDGGAIIRLHDPGNNSWKLKADTDFHIYDDSSSDYVTIKNAGQVGIGSTNAASRLEVNGVIQNQNAFDDPTFTVSQSGMSLANGGTLQFTQGFVGTSSPGDTVVFRYNAVSWKSWALDFTFTSTGNGSGKYVCSGNIGGYNNNSGGYNSNFTQNFGTAITVVMTNVGQNNVITFTGDFGVHLMCTMRYSQSGGDGAPTSARASLTYNS